MSFYGVTDIWTYVIGAIGIILLPGPNSLFVLSVATAVVLLPLLCAWGILADWCETEERWIGWERKRGKLEELVAARRWGAPGSLARTLRLLGAMRGPAASEFWAAFEPLDEDRGAAGSRPRRGGAPRRRGRL